jgi:class 3 adenylate cyclase
MNIFRAYILSGLMCFSGLLIFQQSTMAQSWKAEKGVLDLRTYPFETAEPVSLGGEWNFYWQALHHSYPGINDGHQFMKLPGVWDGFLWKGKKLSPEGYATFHLKILLPPGNKIYSLAIPYIYTAYRMYVDSMLVAENGKVSHEPGGHVSQFLPMVADFHNYRGEIDLVIHVSNFEDRKGGIWSVPKLGRPEKVLNARSRNLALEFFVIGALILVGIYQTGLYFIRKEIKSSLYFGIFCLLIGVHSLFLGSVFIQSLFPGLSWSWSTKLEYMIMYTMPVIFFLFINGLFPWYSKKLVNRIFVLFTVLACLIILFTHKKIFGILLDFLPLPVLAMAVIAFRGIYQAIRDKRHGSRNALVGVIIFLLFIINEILFGLEIIHTGNYMRYGLFIFVAIQSLNIAYIFSQAFEEVRNLTYNLKLTNTSISRFVPDGFLRFLGKPDIKTVELGDQKRAEMSILFVDIRSFTTLSEKMTPQENFDFINSYLQVLSPVIRNNGGFVDKFIGDAIMALFPGKAENAINAALEILKVLKDFNENRAAKNLLPVHVGMGLNTGTVMLGTVGEKERMDTTVISDAVNLASRLETLAKRFDIQIISTTHTLEQLEPPYPFQYRLVHKGMVKGRTEPVTLIEILTEDVDPEFDKKMKIKNDYEKGMQYYQEGNLPQSLKLFQSVAEKLPGDKATANYIRLCQKYLQQELPQNWTGVESFESATA